MTAHDDKRDALIVKLREHCADITNAINGCEDDETRERTHAFDATHLYFDEFAALLSDAADALSAPSTTPQNVGQMLLAVARCAYYALEDSEETGEGHVVTNEHAVDLQVALDALDTLPPEPGYAVCGPNNAAYALRAEPWAWCTTDVNGRPLEILQGAEAKAATEKGLKLTPLCRASAASATPRSEDTKDAARFRWLAEELGRSNEKVGYLPACLWRVASPWDVREAIDEEMRKAHG